MLVRLWPVDTRFDERPTNPFLADSIARALGHNRGMARESPTCQ